MFPNVDPVTTIFSSQKNSPLTQFIFEVFDYGSRFFFINQKKSTLRLYKMADMGWPVVDKPSSILFIAVCHPFWRRLKSYFGFGHISSLDIFFNEPEIQVLFCHK